VAGVIPASSTALEITPEDKASLARLAQPGKTEQRIAPQVQIVLGAGSGAGAGKSNNALAKELKTSRPAVIDWRARFAEGSMAALYDDRPRGRSFRPLVRAKKAGLIARTQAAPPPQAIQWSCRRMAKIRGIGKAPVQRIWQANGLKPHLIEPFKLSNDPDFIAKLEDVAGLYTNPPGHALVFCRGDPSMNSRMRRARFRRLLAPSRDRR
jgi:hypothetical protein